MNRLFKILLYLSLAACLGTLFFRSYVLFNSQFYSSGAESIGLYGILDVAEGKKLYRSPSEHPYSIFVFTPVYPLVLGSILKTIPFTNLNLKVRFIKSAGVLLAFILLFVFWWASPREFSRNSSVFIIALVLSSSRLFDYIGTTRNDLAALLAEFLALATFSNYIESKRMRWLVCFVAVSFLGFWTRQTATLVFISGILWLIMNQHFRSALLSIGFWGLINLFSFVVLFQMYGPSFLDHIFYSNIRLWKSFDQSLITTSLLSYLASIGVFVLLLLSCFSRQSTPKGSVRQFYLVCFCVAGFFGTVSYFRAGGDVNYLFLSGLIGTYFILPSLTTWLKRPLGMILIILQIVVITCIYVEKSKVALQYSQLPYGKLANEVEQRFPGPGLIVGHYAQNMGIYLKDWAYHGPDLTNGTMLALSAHHRLRWLVDDADSSIRNKKINILVDSHPNCRTGPSLQGEWFRDFHQREVLADWLCVYTR